MAVATRFQVKSKQIVEPKQAADAIATQMEKLTQSQAQIDELIQSYQRMEAMLSMLVSQSRGQTSHAPVLNSPPSGCLTASTTPPQPPDPPDFKQFGQRLSNLEFPVFDGTLLDCWIAKVDRFFELKQHGNEEKLDLISLSLEGAPLKWFRRHRREFTDWTDIKRKLMARFGLVKGCSPPEVLPKEKFITKVDQDTDFGSEKESTNSVEITSIKGHEVQGTTVSHLATSCVDNSVVENQKKLAWKDETPVFEHLHEPSRLFDQFDDESQGTLGGSPLERVDEESSGDVKFHLKHKWRSRVLQTLSGLEFCLLPTKLDLRDWPKEESMPHKKKSHQVETFEVLSSLEPSRRSYNEQLGVSDDFPFAIVRTHISQSDLKCVTGIAHRMFDVMPLETKPLKTKRKKALQKTWWFKFKTSLEISILMDEKLSFIEESIEKDITKLGAQQGFKIEVWTGFDLEACIGVITYGWKYKKRINQGQICLNGLCNGLVGDKEKKRESIEFSECHNEWVLRCEQFFMKNNIPPEKKVRIISIHMEDVVGIARCCESSLVQRSSATQSRAPFSPYQNYNDQPYYERKFGNCPEIELDRESDEIKDEKLQDKQPEEDVKTLVISENEQSLECVGDEPSDDEHKDIKTACVFLEISLNRERLIQLGAPPVFSDLLCVKNRIQGRLKMVLLLEFLWLILLSSKMFKSSYVPQNKNQTNQKLSSYWKLLLRLLYSLHNNEWRSFYILMIKSAFKGKEKTVSFNIAVTSCSRFCFFSYSSWMGSHNSYDLSSCVLRQEKNYVMALFPVGEALTLVYDQHTLVAQKKGTETSTGCCYGFHADLDLMADVTAGTADISMDEFSSVCKLLFGVLVLNLIADQVRDWSFFGLLLQWKWHPPPQATSEFHQAHHDKPVFHL